MKRMLTLIVVTLLMVACQESASERFEREAKEYTAQHCPQEIAQEIRLDSVVYSPTANTTHYYYTLSGTLEQQATTDSTAGQEQRKFLLNGICNDVSTKLEKEEKVTFHYIYRNTRGQSLWNFVFKPEDYTDIKSERPETPREKLARETAEFSKKYCPKDIGEGQRLDSLRYDITNNELIHYYTLAGKHITREFLANKKTDIRQQLLTGLKREQSLEAMRKEKVDFVYRFTAAVSGEKVLEFTFTPQDYK